MLYAVKQFRHYLLGRAFVLHTDHQPLQWLSAQKMEGRLCRWALALQEFDFTIKYRRGSSNANADALSRVPTILSTFAGTVTVPELTLEDVAQEQSKEVLRSKTSCFFWLKQSTTTLESAPHSKILTNSKSALCS